MLPVSGETPTNFIEMEERKSGEKEKEKDKKKDKKGGKKDKKGKKSSRRSDNGSGSAEESDVVEQELEYQGSREALE